MRARVGNGVAPRMGDRGVGRRLHQKPGALPRLVLQRHDGVDHRDGLARRQLDVELGGRHRYTLTVCGVSSRVMRRMSESGSKPK